MKKAFLIFIPAIGLLVFLAQIDDDLSEETVSLISRLETDGVSNAYLYLSGVYADESEDPIVVGKNILAESRKQENDEPYGVANYADAKKLPLPKGAVFCITWEAGCLETLFSTVVDIESITREHETLISRSNTFLAFDEYQTLSKPIYSEQLPPYQYLSAAERIKVLKAISAYKNGKAEDAIASLLLQFSALRKSLALQDNLTGKLVFLAKMSEVIDVASIILFDNSIKIDPIPSLSQDEKSLSMAAAREFAISYHAFKDLDQHANFFKLGEHVPDWVSRIFYKPNMTINAITPIYYRLERFVQLPPSDFAREIASDNNFYPSTSTLRNYVGDKLIAVLPNYDEQVARFADFEMKLALFNQTHSQQSASAGIETSDADRQQPERLNGSFSLPLDYIKELEASYIKDKCNNDYNLDEDGLPVSLYTLNENLTLVEFVCFSNPNGSFAARYDIYNHASQVNTPLIFSTLHQQQSDQKNPNETNHRRYIADSEYIEEENMIITSTQECSGLTGYIDHFYISPNTVENPVLLKSWYWDNCQNPKSDEPMGMAAEETLDDYLIYDASNHQK